MWQINYELGDGSTVHLEERFEPMVFLDFAPAALTRADVNLGGTRRAVCSYWDLVYRATRHNTFVQYALVLDPPVRVAGVERPVHALELIAPEPSLTRPVVAQAFYLDESFERIVEVEVITGAAGEGTAVRCGRVQGLRADAGGSELGAALLVCARRTRGEEHCRRDSEDLDCEGLYVGHG